MLGPGPIVKPAPGPYTSARADVAIAIVVIAKNVANFFIGDSSNQKTETRRLSFQTGQHRAVDGLAKCSSHFSWPIHDGNAAGVDFSEFDGYSTYFAGFFGLPGVKKMPSGCAAGSENRPGSLDRERPDFVRDGDGG
jgi:hypothetical protein